MTEDRPTNVTGEDSVTYLYDATNDDVVVDRVTEDREAQDEHLQRHLAECVECWEAMAEQEERWGIDMNLPEHPDIVSGRVK